jgi:RNA polymerase sigma factor for flagellar operon FliA
MNSAVHTAPFGFSRVEDHLDVVEAALAPLSRRLPAAVSRDDLASAGRLALVETLTGFAGPDEEARAYAFTRVRGAMLDELRRLDPLSRRTRARVSALRRASAALAQELGRPATPGEIGEATGLSAGEVERAERLAFAAEAAATPPDDGGDVYAQCPDEDGMSPVAFAESGELAELMQAALARLAPNQAYVVRRYHLEEATLEDIADELGVSKERVRQIRVAGEHKLRGDFDVVALWQAFASDEVG